MGYQTDFELAVSTYLGQRLVDDLSSVTGYDWDNSLELHGMKWYDHEDHMRKLSTMYPDVLFTLNGDGEESGDIWTSYFKNGKMQHEQAKIQVAPFDASKLK